MVYRPGILGLSHGEFEAGAGADPVVLAVCAAQVAAGLLVVSAELSLVPAPVLGCKRHLASDQAAVAGAVAHLPD